MKRDILETIGSPLVCVDSPPGSVIAAKVESFNPGHSSKDRPALAMVRAAEEAGELKPGGGIVEPTSGNTGIGLAIVTAVSGYDLTIVMPASKSVERRRLLRAYGATIELVEGNMQSARQRADEIAEQTGAVQLDQFANEANIEAHYRTTAEEILADVGDRSIDALVLTIGTGGTITGVGRRLREEHPAVEIIGVEPAGNAPIATGEAGEDDFQGMGPGFISEITDVSLIDDVELVTLEAAEAECRRLAREAGILVGQSSGAAMVASRCVAARLSDPTIDCEPPAMSADGGLPPEDCPLVVTLFPDSGERYLTTGMFDTPES